MSYALAAACVGGHTRRKSWRSTVGSNVASAYWDIPFNGVRAWGGCPTLPALQTPHIPCAIVLYFECTMVLYSVEDTRVVVENIVDIQAVMTIETTQRRCLVK